MSVRDAEMKGHTQDKSAVTFFPAVYVEWTIVVSGEQGYRKSRRDAGEGTEPVHFPNSQ